MHRYLLLLVSLCGCRVALNRPRAPASVDITWMSVSNMYYEIGTLGVVTDGYITRLPRSNFYGGGGGGAYTHVPSSSDTAAVRRVLNAIGGPSKVQLLLTGHSHYDHSLDTPTWSRFTGAPIMGSRTTCLQAQAADIPASRCTTIVGGERFTITHGVIMRVIRWNHSGDPAVNPEQHNPVELSAVPKRDPATGGFRVGVAEDFPNGGGNRAFLFTVDGPEGRYSWFFNNSASAVDLAVPIVVEGVDYGAPIDNLRAAMKDAGLASVDLWIGAGGAAVARMVLPVIKPKAFLPVHWDSFAIPFNDGVRSPYSAPGLDSVFTNARVQVIRPAQFMDRWRLDVRGTHAVPNPDVKQALGFTP